MNHIHEYFSKKLHETFDSIPLYGTTKGMDIFKALRKINIVHQETQCENQIKLMS